MQNHLLHMVCLLAMEPPISSEPDALRDETVKVMKTIRPLKRSELVRGQYVGYRDEPGVAPDSDTETYCALRVHVDCWRWAGVPFSIRAGKALAETVQEAVVELRQPPRLLFADHAHTPEPNVLRFRLKPDDTITLEMQAKLPGSQMVSRRVDLDVAYEAGARRRRAPRPTSGCSATRSRATRACSRARTPSRRPGASSTPCSTSTHPRCPTSAARGARTKPPACCPASATGARRALAAGAIDS